VDQYRGLKMTRRRFYAPTGAFASNGKSLTLEVDEARHLRDALRLKSGDEVYVFDGLGKEFRCTIEESRKDAARLNVLSEVEPARPESSLQLTLAVALLKGEKFDLVVQKTTELGATRIVPVITKLADIRLRDESEAIKRVTRWQRIALEAAKQSGRALVPEVHGPTSFASLLKSDADASLMFSERGGQRLSDFKSNLVENPSSITALVGSEGGWTDEEISSAGHEDWSIVTLGGRTLRAETAAIAVTVLLQHTFGDLV
jgi:16S rRNA (uracil1498-N3)-methyltransferase